MRRVAVLSMLVIIFFSPVHSHAKIRLPFRLFPSLKTLWMFHPVIYGYTGEAGVEFVYEKDENKTGGSGLDTSNKETAFTLEFKAGGYSYHPRFLIFLARVLGRYLWEEYKSNDREKSESYDKLDYEFRAALLPEHPYNAEVYTLKHTTFIRRTIESGYRPVLTEKGLILNYEKRPILLSATYVDSSLDENDANDTQVDTETWRYNATFFKGPLHLFWTYTTYDSYDTFTLIDGQLDSYALEGRVRWKGVRWTSRLNKSRFIQESPINPYLRDDLMIWTEEVSMDLNWNLRTFAEFRHYEDTQLTGEFEGFPEQLFDTMTNSASLNINHRLFESLFTTYTLNHVYSKVNMGVSENLTNTIMFDYRKRIPGGLLTAGLHYMRDIAEARGTPTIVNEEHIVRMFERFQLNREGVNSTTISIQIVDENNHRAPLEEDIHYFIYPIGNTFEIQLVDVPPGFQKPDAFATYKLLISYETEGDYKLRSEEVGYRTGLQLFGGLFQPYFEHTLYQQKVLEGIYSGGPEDATRNTVGVASQLGRWSGFVEYTDYTSRYRPYNQKKMQLIYERLIGRSARFHTKLYYQNTSYNRAELSPNSLVYREEQIGIFSRYIMHLTKKNLQYTVSGSYIKTNSYSDSDSYTLDTMLTWRIGKLYIDFNAGIMDTSTDTRGQEQSIINKYLYITVKRRLF